MQKSAPVVAAAILISSLATAQEESTEAEEEGPWSGSVTLGYLGTSGNTDTRTFRTGFEVAYETGKWLHMLDAAGNGGQESGLTTAEAYQSNWKSAYNFAEYDFLFGLIAWRKDRFAGVTEQLSVTAGYGHRFLDGPSHVLSAEAGLGYRASDNSDGTSDSEPIGRGAVDYTWTFSENAEFEQDLIIEAGGDNTYIESVSALSASLVGELALVASYTVRHNTTVPAGTAKTDTLTAISLEYGF